MSRHVWVLLAVAVLALDSACGRQGDAAGAAPTDTAPAANPSAPPARGLGTVPPQVVIGSITFVVNGVEQVVTAGGALQAQPGDQAAVREVILRVESFAGNGGEACVDLAPLVAGGQELVALHQGSHMVPLTPGVVRIDWTSAPWVVSADWTQLSAVVNHWPPSATQDLACAGGRCETDDYFTIPLQAAR